MSVHDATNVPIGQTKKSKTGAIAKSSCTGVTVSDVVCSFSRVTDPCYPGNTWIFLADELMCSPAPPLITRLLCIA